MPSFFLLLYSLTLLTTLSGMEVASGLLVAVWALDSMKTKSLQFPMWKPIVAFGIVVGLGILLGDASTPQKMSDLGRLRFFFFFWSSAWAWKKGLARGYRQVWATVLILIACYSTLQHFLPIDWFRPEGKKVILFADGIGHGPLVLGLFNHHLTFSNTFLLYAPLLLAYGFYAFPRWIGCWALAIWLYLLVMWTGSRAAWFAIPFTVLIISIGKSWNWRGPTIIMVVCLFLGLGIYRTSPDFQMRFSKTFDWSHTHLSLAPRLKLWRAQWEFFKEHPLLGVGWNNNERHGQAKLHSLYPDTANFSGHAHSVALQLLATTGILGLGFFLWIWWEIFSHLITFQSAPNAWSENRWLSLGLLAAFAGFWIQGLTQWNFGDAEVLHNVMFLWGGAMALRRGPQKP